MLTEEMKYVFVNAIKVNDTKSDYLLSELNDESWQNVNGSRNTRTLFSPVSIRHNQPIRLTLLTRKKNKQNTIHRDTNV